MLKASAGKVLPTTIIGSLPRPTLVHGEPRYAVVPRRDGRHRLSRPVRRRAVGLHPRAGARRSRHRHRRRRRFDHDVGGQSWTRYPTAAHGRASTTTNPMLAKVGAGGIAFPRGHILHDYLEARVMPKIDRADRPRRPPVHGDVEDGAAAHDQAGEVRDGHAGARRLRGAGRVLQGHAVADHGDQRRAERGAARPRGRRLSGDPDGGAADPPARRPRARRGRRDQPRVHGRGLQQHGEGAAGQDRGLVPHVLGQPVRAAHVRPDSVLHARRWSCSTRSTPT